MSTSQSLPKLKLYNRARLIFRVFGAALIIAAILQIIFVERSHSENTSSENASEATLEKAFEKNDHKTILKILKEREARLESKELELKALEEHLAKQKILNDERIQKLQVLRDSLTKESDEQKRIREERMAKTIAVVEGMNPKSAAQTLESMDENLAADVLLQTTTTKVSKILNVMEKRKAARLSELVSGRGDASRRPASNLDQKGGEKYDGNKNAKSNDATNGTAKPSTNAESAGTNAG